MNKENFLYTQKLAGLFLEGKYSDTINKKIGLPKNISDDLEEKYGKYSIWFSNVLFDSAENKYKFEKKDPKINIKDLINNENEEIIDFLNQEYTEKQSAFNYILDWLKGRNSEPVIENDKIDFKNLSFKEAVGRSVRWHKEISKIASGTIKDEQGEVVMTFPNGYYWINLNSKNCEDEAKAMGHCGRGSGVLYSLRQNKRPVVTTDVKNGVIEQMRGKANTKPKEEYHRYILDFILSDLVKYFEYNSYNPKDNFYITDLNEKDINKIIKVKPNLFKNQKLDLLKDYQIQELLKVKPDIFPAKEYFKNFSNIEELKQEIPNILKDLNINSLKDFIQKVKSSGKIFEDTLVNTIQNEDLLIKLTERYSDNFGTRVKTLIKILLDGLPKLENYIKETVLKNKDFLSSFMNSSENIIKLVEILILKYYFGNEGVNLAIKILKNPKIKEKIINNHGEDFYDVIMQEIVKIVD
jgi:hypothetical protein